MDLFFLRLEIPQNVQRCCTRCYDKLIVQVRQSQTTTRPIEEEEDDDDESSKLQSNPTNEQNSKPGDGKKQDFFYILLFILFNDTEWTDNDIDAFTEAFQKYPGDWAQIAAYVRRSEQSCRAFYQKYRKANGLIDDEQVT